MAVLNFFAGLDDNNVNGHYFGFGSLRCELIHSFNQSLRPWLNGSAAPFVTFKGETRLNKGSKARDFAFAYSEKRNFHSNNRLADRLINFDIDPRREIFQRVESDQKGTRATAMCLPSTSRRRRWWCWGKCWQIARGRYEYVSQMGSVERTAAANIQWINAKPFSPAERRRKIEFKYWTAKMMTAMNNNVQYLFRIEYMYLPYSR